DRARRGHPRGQGPRPGRGAHAGRRGLRAQHPPLRLRVAPGAERAGHPLHAPRGEGGRLEPVRLRLGVRAAGVPARAQRQGGGPGARARAALHPLRRAARARDPRARRRDAAERAARGAQEGRAAHPRPRGQDGRRESRAERRRGPAPRGRGRRGRDPRAGLAGLHHGGCGEGGAVGDRRRRPRDDRAGAHPCRAREGGSRAV
ncbi:MAG: RuvA, partial [uncultured Gemmatimonadaceae bacterium]